MDYEKYYELTQNLLQDQRIKIIFEPRKQDSPLLAFVPYIAVGGQVIPPNPKITQEQIKKIGMKIGSEQFGHNKANEPLFEIAVSESRFLLKPTEEFAASQRALRGELLATIMVNFQTGDIWLGFDIFEFDEVSRDLDTAIRKFVALVPSFLKSLAVLFRR
jgi:hypothetical protein